MKIHASFGVVLLTLSLALSAWAAPPLFINYQGVLVDGGEPLEDGIYTLTFEIYDDEVGGTMLWWGEYDVEVTSGVFGVLLGESPYPLDIYDFEEYETWIEVQIGSMALTFPRQQMTFVPYCFHSLEALQSDEADLAHDLNCPGCVGAGDIATGAVTEDELADDAVTTDKIADAAVVASKIDKAAVGAYHIDHNAVTANHVDFNYAGSSSEGGAATIASDLACTGCVNATDIGANAVASSEIATGAVNEDEINLPLIFAYSKLNGGIITVENTADGSSGNYPAAFSGSASGSPSSFRVIGLLGSTPPLGSNPAHNLLPMGALGVAGASGTGYGVAGTSDTGYGVYGYSNDKNGVHGVSLGSLADNGVYGETDSTDSTEGGVRE